ncbi:hypothetical protein SUGI_1013160 [Cryptomeria japonica]|nr:hypothetical protein SUGI_1013160 [Cryptomeria japonica]
MEEAQLRFGPLSSADVKLWLTGPNEKTYERNPVYLHSVILKRSQFFDVKMCERWSSAKPTEIRLRLSYWLMSASTNAWNIWKQFIGVLSKNLKFGSSSLEC